MAYTKATLFELRPDGQKLVRKYFHYPPGMSPITDEFDLDHSTLAGKCYLTQKIIAVPNFAEAVQHNIAKSTRDGQAEEYRGIAMACIPVKSRSPEAGEGSQKVLAVLTIDTNVRRLFNNNGKWDSRPYFEERWSREDEAFLTDICSPFLGLLRLMYALEEIQPRLF